MKNELGPTNPTEIMEFLLDHAPEPFPFAKMIALPTLCAWMRWPDDPEVIEDAQTTAAAAIFLHEKENGNSTSIPLSTHRLATSVVNRQVNGSYGEVFPQYVEVASLVAFFMHCPEHLNPSLNKAYFFVEEGGDCPEGDITEAEMREWKTSRTSLKVAWKEQAQAGPLLFVACLHDDGHQISDYAPDDPDYFDEIAELVQSKDRLSDYLGKALWCQQKLLRLLDTNAAAQIDFPEFTSSVKPVDPKLMIYDASQIKLVESYRAPQ
jgi:hypothetical protein